MEFLIILQGITLVAVIILSACLFDELGKHRKRLENVDRELFQMRHDFFRSIATSKVTVPHQKPMRFVGAGELAPEHARPIAADLNYRLDVPHGSTISLQTLYRLKRALSHQARRRLFGED